jgi:O-antigen/teichoic acid export membrane protein
LIFNMLLAVNYSIMAGMGKIKERVYYLAIALCSNLIINILCMIILQLGIVSAIIGNCVARFILWRYSFKVIDAIHPIHIDRYFLFRNTSIILGISLTLIQLKQYIFVMNNNARLENIMYLVTLWVGYYILLALCNTRDIKNVYTEIKNILRI